MVAARTEQVRAQDPAYIPARPHPPVALGGQTGAMTPDASDDQWYFCVADRSVRRGKESRGLDRMGPYPDPQTAARALEIAQERTAAADAADEADDDWGAQ